MVKYWLAINYGAYEGWYLDGPYESWQKALNAAQGGRGLGDEWKILKEVEFINKDSSSCAKEG